MEHISEVLKSSEGLESIPTEKEEIAPEINLKEKHEAWIMQSIPARYRTVTFDNFKVTPSNKKAFTMCKEYVKNYPAQHNANYKSIGIFSNGVWGVGKTHLAVAMAKEIIYKCQFINPVLYTTEPDMFLRLKSTFNRQNDETENVVMKKLTTVPVLIVDDIGKEEVSDPRFVQRAWFSIINTRYDNLLPLILTANLDPDGICNHLGGNRGNEASFDRLYEMLQGTFYEITGESYRRKQWNNGK